MRGEEDFEKLEYTRVERVQRVSESLRSFRIYEVLSENNYLSSVLSLSLSFQSPPRHPTEGGFSRVLVGEYATEERPPSITGGLPPGGTRERQRKVVPAKAGQNRPESQRPKQRPRRGIIEIQERKKRNSEGNKFGKRSS